MRKICRYFVAAALSGTLLLFTFIFWGCAGCDNPFESTPEDQFKNEYGPIDFGPAWSPDGKTIAYSHVPQDSIEQSWGGTYQIWLIDADGTNKRFLTPGNSPDWSPDGQKIVYSDGRILIYDLNTRQISIVERYFKSVLPDWSPDGMTIAYTNSICSGDTCGVWFSSPDGSNKRYIIRYGGAPEWSPDNASVFYTLGYDEIWAYSVGDQSTRLIVDGPGFDIRFPAVSFDGKRLLWQNQMEAQAPQIWLKDLQTGTKKQLTVTGGQDPNWSPDGKQIVYTKYVPNGRIWIMNADGSSKRQLTY